MPTQSIYRCFAISSGSILIVGGQHVSRIFTGNYAVHHGMMLRRWMTLLICYLFGHGSDCRVLRLYRDRP
ncbi:hypothetical protein AHAS_Ahas18G0215700 [Arachis hypogaea]